MTKVNSFLETHIIRTYHEQVTQFNSNHTNFNPNIKLNTYDTTRKCQFVYSKNVLVHIQITTKTRKRRMK
uniref:Putative ovule protein n=1 Tax=Solanum chacoense TaxID=4108 RepID=A0A0V0GGJ9_SOLCH